MTCLRSCSYPSWVTNYKTFIKNGGLSKTNDEKEKEKKKKKKKRMTVAKLFVLHANVITFCCIAKSQLKRYIHAY